MIRSNRQQGFTIIEVMIALVVLSVGLLAIAAMESMALGRNMDANELTVMNNLAAEMVERIRFNRQNAAAYNGIDTINAATRPTAAQAMAQGDYDQWSARLTATRFNGVRGRVAVAAQGPATMNQSQVTVLMTWNAGDQAGTALRRPRSLTLVTLVAPE